MSSTPESERSATATQPFWNDSSVGDLVIRSSDGVNFHVHKDVLSPPHRREACRRSAGRQRGVGEARAANLRPLAHPSEQSPAHPPPPRRSAQIRSSTRGHGLPATCAPPFSTRQAEPAQCLRIGLRVRARRLAALHTLRMPIFFEYVDELELISVRQYHRLCEYRKACGVAALGATSWQGHSSLLEFTPDADKACSLALLEPVMTSAQGCSACWGGIHDKVTGFSELMREELRRLIAEVGSSVLMSRVENAVSDFQVPGSLTEHS
ncbi:hypothetical protein C8Q80DRAFT_483719 [Daedaleopsis nitida]|nr:hypothetical protein C8Q80DRAFT_483719 [Daedaleopsis nitida]